MDDNITAVVPICNLPNRNRTRMASRQHWGFIRASSQAKCTGECINIYHSFCCFVLLVVNPMATVRSCCNINILLYALSNQHNFELSKSYGQQCKAKNITMGNQKNRIGEFLFLFYYNRLEFGKCNRSPGLSDVLH